jgi:hypothetical protein
LKEESRKTVAFHFLVSLLRITVFWLKFILENSVWFGDFLSFGAVFAM